MLPVAYILHQVKDRIRLRIPSRKGDAAFFGTIERGLAACEQVSHVEANPLTGSVLLRHTGNAADLLRYAQEQQLFTLQPEAEPAHTILQEVSDRLDEFDGALRRTTHGAFDLYELLFVGLLSASAIQLLRGRALGPASTLLSHAAALLAVYRAKRAVD